jgi:spore coat protein H
MLVEMAARFTNVNQPGKRLSRARRWSRILVWSAFAVVLTLRLLHPPTPVESRGAGPWAFPERRGYFRPPAHIQPPVSAVPGDLWRIHIDIAPEHVEKLRGYSWSGWGGHPQQRPEVLVTVREGRTLYTNVDLHLKGAAGSFRPFDDKPALTLHFSKHVSGQQFHGYHQISLNNSVQDPSYLSEAICRELFEAAGVPVPRVHHATVLVNDRDLGLYVLTEGWGKPFLRRHFRDVSGNLYDGGFVQDITGTLGTNSGDHRSDRSDLDRLREVVLEPDLASHPERLARVLDVDRFVSLIAMEVMTCHWDGYALNRNNYRLFHDVETDRMVFMPHGLDQMFGVFRSTPDSSILPPMQGLVARALLATPEGRDSYLQRIAALRSQVFLEDQLTNRVRELARRIRPTLAAYGRDVAEQHDAQVAYLCQRIAERARSISEQLDSPQVPIAFDDRRVARLSGWEPRFASPRSGVAHLTTAEEDGRNVLRIAAGPGGGVGAWRTRALLEAGQYRFEGNVQTRGVGPRGGVSLRISGARNAGFQASDEVWSALSHRFTVRETLVEVELICELRTPRGEAWFDRDSLRLVRE